MAGDGLITCRACGDAKPRADFEARDRRNQKYRRNSCAECYGARQAKKEASASPAILPLGEFSTQRCKSCEQDLPLDQFGAHTAARNGLKHDCKRCLSDRSSRWVDENPEKAFGTYLRREYGITLEQYNAMFAEQGGVCAICGEPPTIDNSGRRTKQRRRAAPPKLIVDHDHETGSVRGLLCGQCNLGIGNLKDDPVIVRFALKYLEERG